MNREMAGKHKCKRCGRVLPDSEFYYDKLNHRLQSYCKECHNLINAENKRKRRRSHKMNAHLDAVAAEAKAAGMSYGKWMSIQWMKKTSTN